MSTTTRSGSSSRTKSSKFGAVPAWPTTVETGTGKDPGDALAQEDIVIRYDHPPAGHFGGIM